MKSSLIPEGVVKRLLRRINDQNDAPQPIDIPPDNDRNPPPRIKYVSKRIIRNTAKGIALKQKYPDGCQICRTALTWPGQKQPYVEVHHVRPLGANHRGLDNWDNMLVICPNCHVSFDLLAMAIDPKSGKVVLHDGGTKHTKIRFHQSHQLATENISHHWRRFCATKAH